MDTRTAPQAEERSMYAIMSDSRDMHHIVHVERDDITVGELCEAATMCNEYADEGWSIAIVPRETVQMCSACLRAVVARQQLALKRISEIGPNPT